MEYLCTNRKAFICFGFCLGVLFLITPTYVTTGFVFLLSLECSLEDNQVMRNVQYIGFG